MEKETLEIPEHTTVCFCPLHGILDTISKKWALMIIAVIGNSGYAGFNELKRGLCNVSSKTLSVTLKELEEKDLIERRVMETTPPTVRYYLTISGWELRELLIPLLTWVMKNGGHEEEGCPIHIHMGEKTIEQKKAEEFILEE
jgi:DNA-binding HxlR family transcriptional regulator